MITRNFPLSFLCFVDSWNQQNIFTMKTGSIFCAPSCSVSNNVYEGPQIFYSSWNQKTVFWWVHGGGIEVFETLAFSELQQSSMEKKRRYGYFCHIGGWNEWFNQKNPSDINPFRTSAPSKYSCCRILISFGTEGKSFTRWVN